MIEFGKECKVSNSWFIEEIKDDVDNTLKIIVSPSKIGECGEGLENNFINEADDGLKELLKDSRPIFPSAEEKYEIKFESYITYQVFNESYYMINENEKSVGEMFEILEKSFLLDNLSKITNATKFTDGTYYPDEWKHYRINSENHIVDIISCQEPKIKKLK